MTDLEVLSRAAFGLSLFITYLLLWLGMTTLLAARREQGFGRLAGAALLLGAAFFLSHAMIVGKGPTTSGSGMEFWWRLGWLPAVSVPLAWYATVIRYAGLTARAQAIHRRMWLGFAALGVVIVILLVADNPFANYRSLLLGQAAEAAAYSKPVVWLYLALTVAGFALPVIALVSGRKEMVERVRVQARPWLIGVGLSLLGASAIVAVTATWALSNALPLLEQESSTVNALLSADLAAQVLVAGAAVLLGRAVVAYEVFTERALPRQGFFRRWRSVVLTSAACALLVSLLLTFELRPLYSLAGLSLLGMTAYALFTWQSYRAHERFISRLLPFVASLELSERLLSARPSGGFSSQADDLLRALCEDALGADSAELVLEGDPPTRLSYRRPDALHPTDRGLRLELVVGQGTQGLLLLGPRPDRRPYAAEEIELARACGERLLDAVAGERIGHLLMDLLRRRLSELQVLGTQHKRLLHDEVLPDIHTALLRLHEPEVAGEALSRAHRTISELLHAGPKTAASQIEACGLLGAIREAVRQDYVGEFAAMEWQEEPEVERHLKGLGAGLAAEVIYYASLEAVRNAARHARGSDLSRQVRMQISVSWQAGLHIQVIDDGVGLRPGGSSAGSGEGILFHSTMMAVVGGRLVLAPGPGGTGTAVELWLPAEALQHAGANAPPPAPPPGQKNG
jgi:hypothetical protein